MPFWIHGLWQLCFVCRHQNWTFQAKWEGGLWWLWALLHAVFQSGEELQKFDFHLWKFAFDSSEELKCASGLVFTCACMQVFHYIISWQLTPSEVRSSAHTHLHTEEGSSSHWDTSADRTLCLDGDLLYCSWRRVRLQRYGLKPALWRFLSLWRMNRSLSLRLSRRYGNHLYRYGRAGLVFELFEFTVQWFCFIVYLLCLTITLTNGEKLINLSCLTDLITLVPGIDLIKWPLLPICLWLHDVL